MKRNECSRPISLTSLLLSKTNTRDHCKGESRMTSKTADTTISTINHAASQPIRPIHQRQFDSVSDIASTFDLNLNHTRGGSEDDLFENNVTYHAGSRGDHEFRTYLLNEKSVTHPSLSTFSATTDIQQNRETLGSGREIQSTT